MATYEGVKWGPKDEPIWEGWKERRGTTTGLAAGDRAQEGAEGWRPSARSSRARRKLSG